LKRCGSRFALISGETPAVPAIPLSATDRVFTPGDRKMSVLFSGFDDKLSALSWTF
jgi:hypothetical protein